MKTAKLFNGDKVKVGDTVFFVDSDGNTQTDVIRMRRNRSLFFWNSTFPITHYRSTCKSTPILTP